MSEEESKKSMFDFITLLVMILIMLPLLMHLVISIATRQAEGTVKMTSHSIAGFATALNAVPQTAIYCLKIPAGPERSVAIRIVEIENVKAGNVIVSSDLSSFKTDIPISKGFESIEFTIERGTSVVLRGIKKEESLSFDIHRELIEEINCEVF